MTQGTKHAYQEVGVAIAALGEADVTFAVFDGTRPIVEGVRGRVVGLGEEGGGWNT